MIFFIIFTASVWLAGCVTGATVLRDWLDAPPRQKTPRGPRVTEGNAFHGVTWRHLEVPTCKRRQRIAVIDTTALETERT
jgi:hypothetical protein